jgi:hypothetical protein
MSSPCKTETRRTGNGSLINNRPAGHPWAT